MDFTAEIYNEALVTIEALGLEIASTVLSQSGMPSPIPPAAAPFSAVLHRNTGDLLAHVSSNIPQLIPEHKGIYD